MEKIRTQLINSGFTQDQIEEIKTGFDEGLDITAYADKEFLAIQMRQIRLGQCDGLDLSPFQHLGAGILKQLRLALKNHVKIVPYINEGYDMEQLEAIREALEKKVDIVPYLDKRFRGICIREICLGLGHGLDVSVYADPCYCWQQMREIRFGLEEGLDVSYFNSLMYTAADMKRRRLALQEHPGLAACDGVSTESAGDDGSQTVRIVLAEENTAAYADLCSEASETVRIEILQALNSSGITYGIRYDAIDRMAAGEEPRGHVLVAAGSLPEDGQDGYYEYFFRTNVARTPKTMADGNVDYRNVEWFEQVKKGQKLACYHGATTGKNGMAVTGREIPARKGREQCILTGNGFHRLEDGKTYVADLDGIVSLAEDYAGTDTVMEIQLNVTNLLTVEEVTLATGDVHFDGNVFVKGNVGSGAGIYATGDLLVGGFVESAHIETGGDICPVGHR